MGTIVFTKTYTGSIKRKISEGHIVPSILPELYIETEKDSDVVLTGTRKHSSKIFNIVENKSNVEITANTLNIRITDIFIGGIPYFKKVIGDLKDVPKDVEYFEGNYYTNREEDYLQSGDKVFLLQPIYKLNTYNTSSKVLIRRLKDRFKITIKDVKLDELLIELVSDQLLTPRVTKNYTLFPEIVFHYDNQYRYLIAHTFEEYIKKELHNKSEAIVLRDVPLDSISVFDYSDKYFLITYKTFRSNLFVEHNKSSSTHIEIHPLTDKLVTLKMTNDRNIDTILSVFPKPLILRKFENNPYLETPILKLNPKGYYFLWETQSKYATVNNTPLGCTRILLNRKKILDKVTDSIETSGKISKDFIVLRNNSTKNYIKAPTPLINNLSDFLKVFKDYYE